MKKKVIIQEKSELDMSSVKDFIENLKANALKKTIYKRDSKLEKILREIRFHNEYKEDGENNKKNIKR